MDSVQKSAATQTDAPVVNDGRRILISTDNSRGLLNLTEWTIKETCFGDVLRGPSGETLLPTGLFEEVADSMKELSKRKHFFFVNVYYCGSANVSKSIRNSIIPVLLSSFRV